MSNPILPKRSYDGAVVPSVDELETHELAINWADKVAFTKDSSGSIVSAQLGGSSDAASITSGTFGRDRIPLATTTAAGAVVVGSGISVTNGTISATSSGASFVQAPESSTSSGTAGTLAYDGLGNLYLCYSSNSWKKFSGSDFLSFTRLLLHADGSSIVDSSSSPLTCSSTGSGASLSTAQSKFGGSSFLFNGEDVISIDNSTQLYADTGDFTVELWVRFTSTSGFQGFAQSKNSLSGGAGSENWWIGYAGEDSPPKLVFAQHSTSNAATAEWSPSVNTWYHVAAVRHNGTVYLFIDGVSQSVSNAESLSSSSFSGTGVAIGGVTTPAYFSGYIDEFRLSVGIARYTASFTPQTSAFTG